MAFLQKQSGMNGSDGTDRNMDDRIRREDKQESPGFLSNITSPRARKQLGIFVFGAGFLGLSTLITRRALVRRYRAIKPQFYQPSNQAKKDFNGPFEAFEALNIATVNVVSAAIMLAGGTLWALDISTMDDLRRKIRTGMGVDPNRSSQDLEEEMEEWVASVLTRKEEKEKKSRNDNHDR